MSLTVSKRGLLLTFSLMILIIVQYTSLQSLPDYPLHGLPLPGASDEGSEVSLQGERAGCVSAHQHLFLRVDVEELQRLGAEEAAKTDTRLVFLPAGGGALLPRHGVRLELHLLQMSYQLIDPGQFHHETHNSLPLGLFGFWEILRQKNSDLAAFLEGALDLVREGQSRVGESQPLGLSSGNHVVAVEEQRRICQPLQSLCPVRTVEREGSFPDFYLQQVRSYLNLHGLSLYCSTDPMFNYMGCNEEMIVDGVEKFGVAPGARKMMDNEYIHAEESIKTGLYITYANPAKKSECTRLGKNSKCFCSHLLSGHNNSYFGKKLNTACKDCPCKVFKFIPTRPEECGMYWLPRRKDFDVGKWRAPCKCKHTCEEHDVNYPLRCKACKTCYGFSSNFACISCDDLWENHEVLYQMEEERRVSKKAVGKEYLPLAQNQNIQQMVFNKPKHKMVEGPKQTAEEAKQKRIRHESLNPKQPSKEEAMKLKSPLGIIMKPKYPDFLKK